MLTAINACINYLCRRNDSTLLVSWIVLKPYLLIMSVPSDSKDIPISVHFYLDLGRFV